MSGIEFIREFKEKPQIILISSKKEYAAEAGIVELPDEAQLTMYAFGLVNAPEEQPGEPEELQGDNLNFTDFKRTRKIQSDTSASYSNNGNRAVIQFLTYIDIGKKSTICIMDKFIKTKFHTTICENNAQMIGSLSCVHKSGGYACMSRTS